MKTLPRLLLGAALVLAVTSCTLRQPAIVTQDYVLKLPVSPSAGPVGSRNITVLPFTAAPAASGQMLLYRTGNVRYESDFYNRLIAPPSQLLTGKLRQWLADSKVGVVREPGSLLPSDWVVQPRLNELHADYRDVARPKAVVTMDMTLTGRGGADSRQLFRRTYRREIPMKDVSPSAAVEGWGHGVAQIFAEFTRDLRGVKN